MKSACCRIGVEDQLGLNPKACVISPDGALGLVIVRVRALAGSSGTPRCWTEDPNPSCWFSLPCSPLWLLRAVYAGFPSCVFREWVPSGQWKESYFGAKGAFDRSQRGIGGRQSFLLARPVSLDSLEASPKPQSLGCLLRDLDSPPSASAFLTIHCDLFPKNQK